MARGSKKAKASAGAPAWMTTFADLMALLMCFFVLLLSFAELDVIKFKMISGSLKWAFGVQRVVQADQSPADESAVVGEMSSGGMSSKPASHAYGNDKQKKTDEQPELSPEIKAEVERIKKILDREVKEGKLEIEGGMNTITMRIQERKAFPSGSADILEEFAPMLERIARVLDTTEGSIAVAGHTDNQPINTPRFRSNWELSTSRAVTVVHHLLNMSSVTADRVEVRGHGDAIPLVPNDSAENRAINRRVEIIVSKRLQDDADDETQNADDAATTPGEQNNEGMPTIETILEEAGLKEAVLRESLLEGSVLGETLLDEMPATEPPATEAPATELPATEAPTTALPATEAPATELPATEAPATETPSVETPAHGN